MQARIIVGGWHPALHRLEVQTLLEAAGVESEVGEKDPELVHAFISAARSASSAAAHPSEQEAPP